jgi:hypothetical protein
VTIDLETSRLCELNLFDEQGLYASMVFGAPTVLILGDRQLVMKVGVRRSVLWPRGNQLPRSVSLVPEPTIPPDVEDLCRDDG